MTTPKIFAQSSIGVSLDALGQRYGVRPSHLLGYHPLDGRGLMLDFEVASAGIKRQLEAQTVKGQYEQKKASWDRETFDEVRRNMV